MIYVVTPELRLLLLLALCPVCFPSLTILLTTPFLKKTFNHKTHTIFSTAGSQITVEMHAQPNDRVCTKEAIGGNHFGPVMIYMSKVTSAASDLGSANWFKISEEGYNPSTKKWGTVCFQISTSLPLPH